MVDLATVRQCSRLLFRQTILLHLLNRRFSSVLRGVRQ